MITYSFTDLGSDCLYIHLYKCIKNDILQDVLHAGEKLPSKRSLAKNLNISIITVENAYSQLHALSVYLDADIWIVNPSGTVVVNSLNLPNLSDPQMIQDFDPSVTASSYYVQGNFFNQYNEEMLTVFTPRLKHRFCRFRRSLLRFVKR